MKINNVSLLIILLAAGLIGGLIFLPLPINGQYTCFYHRFSDSMNHSDSHMTELAAGTTSGHESGEHNDQNDLFKIYSHRYVIPWWLSLALIAFAGHRIFKRFNRRRTKKVTNTISEEVQQSTR